MLKVNRNGLLHLVTLCDGLYQSVDGLDTWTPRGKG